MTSAGDDDFSGEYKPGFGVVLNMVQRDDYGIIRGKWRKRGETRDALLYRPAPSKPYNVWPGAYWPRIEELETMPRIGGVITWRLSGGRIIQVHELMWPDGTVWRVPEFN